MSVALVADRAGRRREIAREQVDERGLAGAVGAEHRVQPAAMQLDRRRRRRPSGRRSGATDPCVASIGVSHRRGSPTSVRLNRPVMLARPPGRKITSRMIVPPSSNCQCVVSRRVELLQRDEDECAGDGAVEAAQAAQDQHQQHVARLVPRQQLGIDESELHARTGSRRARRARRRCVKLASLYQIDREAQRAHAVLVAADALQRAAERRAQQHAQKNEHERPSPRTRNSRRASRWRGRTA